MQLGPQHVGDSGFRVVVCACAGFLEKVAHWGIFDVYVAAPGACDEADDCWTARNTWRF